MRQAHGIGDGSTGDQGSGKEGWRAGELGTMKSGSSAQRIDGGVRTRPPQSVQSVPSKHLDDEAPGPPSSQTPSEAVMQELSQARVPQSSQSDPTPQLSPLLPCPPSSHRPLSAVLHSLPQTSGAVGGNGGGGGVVGGLGG